MINIKTEREIELMKIAGNIVYETHQMLKPHIKPGISTLELDELAHEFILGKSATPSFLGYDGFPNSICASLNDEVVHGIPNDRKLKDGDVIKIDIGANYKGYHGDSAWTYAVGKINSEVNELLIHTEQSLYEGIKQVKPGNRIGDISNAVENYAIAHNLGVVEELVGHGVGSKLHEDPNVPNYGTAGTGPILKKGMVIAIEPMLNLGTKNIYIGKDNWTVKTSDNKPSAHFEHTVLVTEDGNKILTGSDNIGKK